MTIYITKAEMKKAIERIKKENSKKIVIVKDGYNNYDDEGYLVSEVRVQREARNRN